MRKFQRKEREIDMMIQCLPDDFFVTLNVEIGLIDFDGFEPGAVVLDEVEQGGRHVVLVGVHVGDRLHVGEVANMSFLRLRVIDANPT